jgi:hypothetical protein
MVIFALLNQYSSKYIFRLRACGIALLLCCVYTFTHAQAFVLKGVVFKTGTTTRLSKVVVFDLNNNIIVNTDELGVFQIKCNIGDSILFRQKDYADRKMGVITQNTLMVYMQTNIGLSEVEIRGITKKQELQQVMKEYNSQGIYSNGKPSVASAILSPLNGLYDLFGSGPKQARRFNSYTSNELEQTEVDRRFTKTLVQQITGLKDERLQLFVQNYRPSYDDLKGWNDYDLINYIKKSHKNFEDSGEQPPPSLPKLIATPKPHQTGN